MGESEHDPAVFAGLQALADAAFPKRCNSCGRLYETAEQFIAESKALRAGVTGLKQGYDDHERHIVEVYRNCPCGSTLMGLFENRRDTSKLGEQRRSLFKAAEAYLIARGLSSSESRLCLLRLLRGDATPADMVALSGNLS